MADTVTISKEYFDTLLRRTQMQAEGNVMLPQYEFDFLLKSTQDYATLRSALIGGGLEAATLDLLINGTSEENSSPKKTTQQQSALNPHPQTWCAQAAPFVPQTNEQIHQTVCTEGNSKPHYDNKPQLQSPNSTSPDNFGELNYDGMRSVELTSYNQQYGRGQDPEQDGEGSDDVNQEHRSVVLQGISPFTTMADVLAVIRGGAVLNMYLRPQQRTAHVAFVESIAAEKFLIHCKRNDIYVKGKRMEVFWDDNQYFLPAYLARRIHDHGASRNLVIRFPTADMTEESIRADLDHIHRLEVVQIRFEFGHAWIPLNSVQQAITARSCMGSRLKYKGTRIEFSPDTCAASLPPVVKRQERSQPAALRHQQSAQSFSNRFAMLTVDHESHSSTGFGSPLRGRV